jgi:hypothetical protein
MGDDDLLMPGALRRTIEAFNRGKQIGVVTRPYYWFWDDPAKPIRAILPYDSSRDAEISIFDGPKEVQALIRSAGQMSALAFRREYVDHPFHADIFPTHVYPFMSILKKYHAVYLKDFVVAIRTPLSMSTNRSGIYERSPLNSWVDMFENLYGGARYDKVRQECIRTIVEDTYSGLPQIRTTASRKLVAREMRLALRYYPQSNRRIAFYGYGFISIVCPGKPLRVAIDWYKRNILSRRTGEMLRRLQSNV